MAGAAGTPRPGAVEAMMLHLLAEGVLAIAAVATFVFVVVDGINNGDWR